MGTEMEPAMSFPLFDSGYTLWAADLEARLMDRHGKSSRTIGVEARLLLERYYGGESVSAALAMISDRYGLAR
ncbi:MAG: hypothetical protein K2X44_13010 [Magnetospirillum sp.]|nr:hypothetical protein [Magnetospirillum sp.]